MTIDELRELLRTNFPIQSQDQRMTLEFVDLAEHPDDGVRTVLRLIVWDVEADSRMIRDVKEQEVEFASRGKLPERARLEAYLRALAHVATRVLATSQAEWLMPHELFDTSPLKLVKASSEQDFVAALEKKSRLGKYLPVA
jgi:hypothetical protein